MPHSAICDPWDVVVVPFPFVERPGTKRRPAVVLSEAAFNQGGNSILAMITTAPTGRWPTDIEISDLGVAGLPAPCVIRLKLFTLDNRLVVRRAGALSTTDRAAARATLRRVFALR